MLDANAVMTQDRHFQELIERLQLIDLHENDPASSITYIGASDQRIDYMFGSPRVVSARLASRGNLIMHTLTVRNLTTGAFMLTYVQTHFSHIMLRTKASKALKLAYSRPDIRNKGPSILKNTSKRTTKTTPW